MDITRFKKLNRIEKKEGNCVIYVMSRDQRVKDNFALLYAQEHAEKKSIPLIVAFNLYPKVNGRLFQHFEFMITGLKEVQNELETLNIPFIVTIGSAVKNYLHLEKLLNPEAFYFDFSPLRAPLKIKSDFAEEAKVPLYVVDTHNIVPIWITSEKEEFAAYTIRPKIYKNLNKYLVEPSEIKKQSKSIFTQNELISSADKLYLNPTNKDWELLENQIKAEKVENYVIDFESGSKAALKILNDFIENKLSDYAQKRNDPTLNFQSDLSPYLHYGQISSLRAVLEVKKNVEISTGFEIVFDSKRNMASHKNQDNNPLISGASAFVEEITVRKELSDNYCYYNQNYDNFGGLKPWAQTTLLKHQSDIRENLFTLSALESAKTYDDAWNAAQIQLITKGKIHGYMRMYWAKKILEWTPDPKTAIKYCVYLNDKYHIDGYDPNGYAGIMWSIGGIHDRPWFEREIFGQIRYMNYSGLKRKFDLKEYVKKFIKNE